MHTNTFDSPQCEALKSPSKVNVAVAVFLVIGIAVSYVPQHIRIIQRKTSEGLSPLFLLLGVCSSICAFLNMTMLSTYIVDCCRTISRGECSAAYLGVAQVGIQATMGAILIILAVKVGIDHPPATLEAKDRHHRMLLSGQIALAFTIVSILLSVIVVTLLPAYIVLLANIWGLLGTGMACFQYFPQIYTTASLKHAGSLSIPMMCMQTPGGFLWAVSLALRPETKWSSWLPYFSAAILQGVLLVMAVYFEYFKGGYAVDAAEERAMNDPLLGE